jgi:hypothetical protein
MPLEIPPLDEAIGRICACGFLKSDDPDILEKLSKRTVLVGKRQIGGHEFFQRLILGRPPKKNPPMKSKHVHIELAKTTMFNNDLPEVNSSVEEIENRLSEFFGQRAEVFGSALYFTANDSLPANSIVSIR